MHFDGLLKVPIIVQEPVSTLDLSPTFFDYGATDTRLPQHASCSRPYTNQAGFPVVLVKHGQARGAGG